MVAGVITAEEMLLSSLGRILSAPGASSPLSFPNIFVIISSVICISVLSGVYVIVTTLSGVDYASVNEHKPRQTVL